ncbi:hypothetical protein BDN72DRAFT_848212 [Pluteus cervinus]|uniref:Uncharacterized protein n=1 Tax=Pluteus cervinus TaxID=181527 RepID=A0ACD3AB95_9AGAR|nr:hypothetical protein BDN72DRAFT_848212 [Pluteus cervinus]
MTVSMATNKIHPHSAERQPQHIQRREYNDHDGIIRPRNDTKLKTKEMKKNSSEIIKGLQNLKRTFDAQCEQLQRLRRGRLRFWRIIPPPVPPKTAVPSPFPPTVVAYPHVRPNDPSKKPKQKEVKLDKVQQHHAERRETHPVLQKELEPAKPGWFRRHTVPPPVPPKDACYALAEGSQLKVQSMSNLNDKPRREWDSRLLVGKVSSNGLGPIEDCGCAICDTNRNRKRA